MFQRREALSIFQRAKEFLWPSIGWKRSFLYVKHRLIRLSDSTHKIALGLAIGASISFSPIIGTHFMQAGALTYVLRGNILSSIFGTFIGNPLTFPFMWWASFSFGSLIFQIIGLPTVHDMPTIQSLSDLWHIIANNFWEIFMPWFVGGYLLVLLSLPFSYYIFFRFVKTAKLARQKARLRKMHKVAREVTGQRK